VSPRKRLFTVNGTSNILLKAEEVAAMLRIASKSVHKLARKGEIGFVRVNGRDRRFTNMHVDEYIQRNTVNTPVDVKPNSRVSCLPKGGEKSTGVSGTNLIEEMRSW